MLTSVPARGPNAWPDAQRAFMASDPTDDTAPALPVWIRWWNSDGFGPMRGGLVTLVVTAPFRLARRSREGPEGTWVGVWYDSAPRGAPPSLVVKVADDELPSTGGEASAVLLGEPAPNGAMCLVVDGRRIRPVFNPQVPTPPLSRAAGSR